MYAWRLGVPIKGEAFVWEGTEADVGVQWLQRARCRVVRVLDTSNFLPLSPSLVGAGDVVKRLEIQGPSPRAYDSGWKHHDGGAQCQQVPGLANGHGRLTCPLKLHTVAALAERADNLHPIPSDRSSTVAPPWSYLVPGRISCHATALSSIMMTRGGGTHCPDPERKTS